MRGADDSGIGLVDSEKGVDLCDYFDCFSEGVGYSAPFERGLFLLS